VVKQRKGKLQEITQKRCLERKNHKIVNDRVLLVLNEMIIYILCNNNTACISCMFC
jgi:hypothetical protein